MKKQIEKILNAADAFDHEDRLQDTYVILVNGRRIKTRKGKSIWSGIAGAKKALKSHINRLLVQNKFSIVEHATRDENNIVDWDSAYESKNKIINDWIQNNVMFVPFETYSSAKKKATGKTK